jgi:predicted DNA-binding transcriptional regulator AlpA
MSTANLPELLNKTQFAQLLGTSPRNLERYIAQRTVPMPIRIGKQSCLRWRRSTIMRWLEAGEAAANR